MRRRPRAEGAYLVFVDREGDEGLWKEKDV